MLAQIKEYIWKDGNKLVVLGKLRGSSTTWNGMFINYEVADWTFKTKMHLQSIWKQRLGVGLAFFGNWCKHRGDVMWQRKTCQLSKFFSYLLHLTMKLYSH